MTFPVTPEGVGKKDYSMTIERSVEPVVLSHQVGYTEYGHFTAIPYIPFPWVWTFALTFVQADGSVDIYAYHSAIITGISCKLKRNTLTISALYEYATLADFMAGVPLNRYGTTYGYGHAVVNFGRGVKTTRGRIYAILGTDWGGGDFDLDINAYGVEDLIV